MSIDFQRSLFEKTLRNVVRAEKIGDGTLFGLLAPSRQPCVNGHVPRAFYKVPYSFIWLQKHKGPLTFYIWVGVGLIN